MEIIIRLVDGQLSFNTNSQDKVAMLGALELAKSLVLQQAAAPAVQPAPPQLQKFLAGRNGHPAPVG